MRDFKTLQVWQKAHQLTLSIYQTTNNFPANEQYGLTSQTRRAAASIPANIAEGCGRDGDAELKRFFQIAMGSASELEYHLILARDLKLLPATNHRKLEQSVIEVKKMLASFIKRLRTK
jgi:four helix bundle protein